MMGTLAGYDRATDRLVRSDPLPAEIRGALPIRCITSRYEGL